MKLNVDKKYVDLGILTLGFLAIFLITIFLRSALFENHSIPGEESYLNIKIAKDISGFLTERFNITEIIWPSVIKLLSEFFNVPYEFSIMFLSLILGLSSVILLYYIVDSLELKKKNLSIGLFIISPVTMWLFLTFSKYVLVFFLSLLTIYFILKDKKTIAIILIGITSLLGVVASLSVIVLSIICFSKKDFKSWIWKSVLISLFINVIIYFIQRPEINLNFNFGNLFGLLFSLAPFGLSIFILILAFIGIFATWKNKTERKELMKIYLVFILFYIFSLFEKDFVFMLNIPASVLAAIGFTKLINRGWASKIIRNLSIAIIVFGLIFTTVSMSLRIADFEPENNLIDSLEFLKNKKEGKVLADEGKGYWIEVISEKEVVINKIKSNRELRERVENYWRERNVDRINKEFVTNNIKYILIDEETRSRFRTNDEGIILLLKYSDNFKQIYEEGKIEIWEFEETK